jgi:hypothetical protein
MRRQSCIPFLLCVPALFSLTMRGRAGAQCDTPLLRLHVDSIYARETGTEIDQRLGPETVRLRALFDYSSYRLLRTEEADTPCGEEVAFLLPAGRVLHVRPLATRGGSVVLELALFAGPRALLRQQLKIWRGGLLLLVGSQNPQDAYITTLTIDAPGTLQPPAPPGAATMPATPSPPSEKPLSAR